MAFTLYSLIQTAILCTNAIAVLHEERFLSKSKYLAYFLKGTFIYMAQISYTVNSRCSNVS